MIEVKALYNYTRAFDVIAAANATLKTCFLLILNIFFNFYHNVIVYYFKSVYFIFSIKHVELIFFL
jgi:hypothetical protein